MQAHLTSHNQPPRKVRLVTEMVKGKSVAQALKELSFLPKRAAAPIHKLISSAAANATVKGSKIEDLKVENITVDSAGMTVKFMPRAMGRAAPVRRRKSQVSVFLSDASASNV
jgi:large subunit ribosomal protein L22